MKKSTKVLVTIAGGALMAAASFSSCKKSSSTTPLPPIGGYDSSNQIASSNLLAHWTFENTLNELKSGTGPTTNVGITYTTGVDGIGKAAQFSNGYAVFPTIAALSSSNALFANGFTVSAWVKVANNGTSVYNLFALTSPLDSQTDWNNGAIEMYVEANAHAAGSDTIQLHTAFASYSGGTFLHNDNVNGFGTVATDSTFQFVFASDSTWIHYLAEYNASTSYIQIYADGILVSNKQYQYRANGSAGLGALNILTPTQVVLGSFANNTVGFTADAAQSWQALFTGTMDDLRVYNTPLAASDISALYQLEQVGR